MTPSLPTGPVSWLLERNERQVTFASCRQLSVFTDTTSTALSAVHARPAWTLLVPVDGGSVTVVAGAAVRVDDDGVLVPPQTWHRVATQGPHVAVYLHAVMATRVSTTRPRLVPASVARRMLEALAVDSGIDFEAAIADLDPSFRNPGAIDPRLAFAIDALPDAYRLDVLAAEIGMSPSRLRALVHDGVGAPLTQLRLWSRLGRAIALLPHSTAADAAATAGFADQAHLTRTARRFLGRAPAELSLRSLELRAPNPRWRASAAAASHA
jgi:AraC-like DNA-binding protein